jgi:chromosome segregation ATPase
MNEFEEIDATINELEERLEILGDQLKSAGKEIQSIRDRLTILEMEIDFAEEGL